MDSIISLIIFLVGSYFLLGIVALVKVVSLGKRVREIEARLGVTEGGTPPVVAQSAPVPAPSPENLIVTTPASTENVRVLPPTPSQPDALERFMAWIKEDFLMKLGAFLLLCALGWFVSYAFANNWIGEMGRITLGLLLGAGIMVVGVMRAPQFAHQGGVLLVLGSSTILLTTFAAREIYNFFTPVSATFIMALSVVFVAFVSVKYDRRTLALASLVLAVLAPQFTAADHPDVIALFSYLLMVVLGTLWVVYLRGWSILTLGALISVFLYGLPYVTFGVSSGDVDAALLFAFVFTAIFFVANIIGLIANENEENRQAHIIIALGTGLYLIQWVGVAASPEWQSLLYVLWMLVFSLGSFIVYRVQGDRGAFFMYGGVSLTLLAAATAAELSGPALTIAFTVEIGALVLASLSLMPKAKLSTLLSFLFIVPVLLSLESLGSSAWYRGVLHDDFFVLGVLMVMLGTVGNAFLRVAKESDPDKQGFGVFWLVTAALYKLALIWLVLHSPTVVGGDSATMLTLIIYTLIALPLIIYGTRTGERAMRVGGMVLLGFVVARLLFIEVWDMELTGRIMTFAAIGVLLIGTAFLRKQKREATNQ